MDPEGTGSVSWQTFKTWWDSAGCAFQPSPTRLQALIQLHALFEASGNEAETDSGILSRVLGLKIHEDILWS